MKLIPGKVNQLTVKRKTDIGFMLGNEHHETVFLHINETHRREIKEGELVSAFLYYDHKARLAATLSKPKITIEEAGFVTVESQLANIGVFVNIGISKGVLVSKDDLPKDPALWPQSKDSLYCIIKTKETRLVAKPLMKHDIGLTPLDPLTVGTTVTAVAIKVGEVGSSLMTKDGHIIFVHRSLERQRLRLGQYADVTIIHENKGEYNGSFIGRKESMIDDDAKIIYTYLLSKKGKMPFTADSNASLIVEEFNLSKKAFKRALGSLYKKRLVTFENGWTLLTQDKQEKNADISTQRK